MGNRILEKAKHYHLHHFAAALPVLLLLAQIVGTIWAKLSSTEFFQLPASMYRDVTTFLFLAAWGMLLYLHVRQVAYADETGGRSYRKDHANYPQYSYRELVEHYKTADRYRINPVSLPEEDWRSAEGIILGKVGRRLVKRPSDAPGNLLSFGLPGSGKTLAQLVPTALRFRGSIVVIDIKGDILHHTYGKRNIQIFDPEHPQQSCHFDPLAGMASMSPGQRRLAAESLACIIIPNEPDGKYFIDGARDFFCGILLACINQCPTITFPQVVSSILQQNAFGWVKNAVTGNDDDAKAYLASYYGSNEKNVAGCYNALCKAIRPYDNSNLSSLLDGQGACISAEMLDAGQDIYLEIPQDKFHVYAPITTIIIQSILSEFMGRPDIGSGHRSRPILIILDEFPQLQFSLETITSALATLRSKNVTLFLAQQSIAQLESRYGAFGAREIMDTCAYISILSAQDPRSREYFQKLIGTREVLKKSVSDSQRSDFGSAASSRAIRPEREYIYQPEDFGNLDNKVLIYANGKYIEAEKTFCFE